jgi:peptidoglycan/xylan/chitin deacetylase (PgdA/CDA1 family)
MSMRWFVVLVALCATTPVSAHWDLGFEPWLQRTAPEPIPDAAKPRTAARDGVDARGTERYSNSVRVLGFHDIFIEPSVSPTSDVLPDNFRDMMQFLKRAGYNVVKVRDVTNFLHFGTPPLPDNAIAITFDDDYRGQYWEAFPILQGLSFPATFYVHSGYVGVMTSKDHSTWAELQTMEATGLYDTQSHTVNHVDLSAQTPTKLNSELVDSRNTIQTRLSKTVSEICYPYGGYNATVITASTAAGYTYGFTTNGGLNSAGQPLFEIKRNLLGVGDTLQTFKNMLGYVGTDPGGPVIVDNGSTGYTASGFAPTGSTATDRGQYGQNWGQNAAVTGTATATAQWSVTVPAAGSYDIFAWWPGASGTLGENTGARYSVVNGALSDTRTVNQTASLKGRWNKIGTWTLTTSNPVVVTLTNSVTAGTQVYADAIKIQPASSSVADWERF